MKSIEEALKLTDPLDIANEIFERKKLINEMVGNLYPRILEDEIFQLYKLAEISFTYLVWREALDKVNKVRAPKFE